MLIGAIWHRSQAISLSLPQTMLLIEAARNETSIFRQSNKSITMAEAPWVERCQQLVATYHWEGALARPRRIKTSAIWRIGTVSRQEILLPICSSTSRHMTIQRHRNAANAAKKMPQTDRIWIIIHNQSRSRTQTCSFPVTSLRFYRVSISHPHNHWLQPR